MKALALFVGLAATLVSALLVWSLLPSPSHDAVVSEDETAPKDAAPAAVTVRLESADKAEAVELLAAAGVLDSPRLMGIYLRFLLPTVTLEPGEHLLRKGLSPRELAARLARLPGRTGAKLVVPEGWHRKKIAARLEKSEICRAESFLRATEDRALLERLGVSSTTAEGYLFPATYELGHNTAPSEVVSRMVKETRRRLETLLAKHPGALERLRERHGFGEAELLSLASIVERETSVAAERPLIASVFLNRLSAKDGETRGRLQSDPTAAYGCEFEPERAPSCATYDGKVGPSLLRDPENRYNTYRHPGLPPGPIASPGLASLEAVLAPADSDYLFFVADGSGKHAFSRTFEEHQSAVARLRAVRASTTAAATE